MRAARFGRVLTVSLAVTSLAAAGTVPIGKAAHAGRSALVVAPSPAIQDAKLRILGRHAGKRTGARVESARAPQPLVIESRGTESGTLVMLISGIGLIGFVVRRRRLGGHTA
jgi:hypothetical protein